MENTRLWVWEPDRGMREIRPGWLISWYPATAVANTLAVGNHVCEKTDEFTTVRMEGKCALVQGWEKMGLSPEEVEYLCDIASYGDYGHANALDLQGTWLCTSAQKGCDYCDFKIEKLKEKTIV